MTHRLDSTRITGDDDHPRWQLTPHALTSKHLDGARWPRSTQLSTELPALVTALFERLGELAVVGYHRNAWTPAPEQLRVAGETITLPGFTSDEPATVIRVGRDGRCVILQVIPPAAHGAVARETLDAAARDTSGGDVGIDPAEQFIGAPIQAFVAIPVHHVVRNRMGTRRPRSESQRS